MRIKIEISVDTLAKLLDVKIGEPFKSMIFDDQGSCEVEYILDASGVFIETKPIRVINHETYGFIIRELIDFRADMKNKKRSQDE